MPKVEKQTPDSDSQFHRYRGNEIPWYVRLMWLGFWVIAVTYTIRFLFPALRFELFNPS
jgi:hypothetical protein